VRGFAESGERNGGNTVERLTRRACIIAFVILIMAIWRVNADPAHEIVRARELVEWIHEHVEYVPSKDVIKTPADTLMTGGDCADFSALMIALLKAEEIDAEMLLLDLVDFEAHHAVVILYGKIFDPVTGRTYRHDFPLAYTVGGVVSYENLLLDWE